MSLLEQLLDRGVVVVRELLEGSEVEMLRDCFRVLRTDGVPTTQQVLYTHALPSTPRPGFDRLFEQWFNPHARDGRGSTRVVLERLASRLAVRLAKDLYAFQDVLLAKDSGHAPLPWHQDQPFWPVDTPWAAVVWCALDPVDRERGGLELAIGSHHQLGPAIDLHTGEPQLNSEASLFDSGAFEVCCPVLAPGDATILPCSNLAPLWRQPHWTPPAGVGQHMAASRCVLESCTRTSSPSRPRGRPWRLHSLVRELAVARITWLVGPPGAGKSSFARSQLELRRSVELTSMLGPLVDPLRIRKGVLTANARLLEVIRAIESHPENALLEPLLVVAGLVPEDSLFPLRSSEQVWLLLPERARWELQLRSRPSGAGSSQQYDDFEYASLWYEKFRDWQRRGLPLRRINVDFNPAMLGKIVTR